ncbi:hypothetical protein NEDG_01650 [Nematocida displodere]|uniref:Cation/H+ exchanger transmembrane domain-containing protein n=1 Tax=Nematocida displodere TaxID=1805483 RepID=A0A177EH12_9MICR|nr:hypothetical protein NEDG_01650 [Nematocida displodere]
MENFAACCSLLGGFILSFGVFSLLIKEKLYIAESAVATIYGMICKVGLKYFGMGELVESHLSNSTFIFHFAHMVMSLQLVAVAVTVPKTFFRKNWLSIATLLLPVMAIMFGISTLIVKYVCGFGWPVAMIAGACVTPTDPILASAVLKGRFANKYIPSRLRHLLAIESGSNDGLGFPLLTLPIFLMKHTDKPGGVLSAFKDWFYCTWLFEILVAVVIGVLIGLFARALLKYSLKQHWIDKESFLVYALALAVLVTGVTALIGSDDLLAVFVAGLAFAWDDDMVQDIKDSHIMEVVDLIFNHAFFIIFGAILPMEIFNLKHMSAAFLIILFRRLPGVYLMRMLGLLPGLGLKETFFAGWFGPIGVAAIFFGYHAQHVLGERFHAVTNDIIKCVYAIVFLSIIIHGTTAPVIHLHLRRRQKKGKKEIDVYGSDTEAERDLETPHLQQIV